jgi:glycosyl transferase family 25
MGAPFRALAQDDLVAAAEGAAAAMIPVYVINLTRSPGRRAFMAQGLAQAGVTPEFVAAVDGRAPRLQRLAPIGLSAAETALILSHRKAWRRLLASGADFAVVLEDDAHAGEHFADLLRADWSAHAFDAVKLETMFDSVWMARRGPPLAGRELRRLGAEHLGAAGYLVGRAGAGKLLAMTRGLVEPVDQTLFGREAVFSGRVRVLQLTPAAIVQDRLLPDASARREIATTLQEPDRKRLAQAARSNKPRGLRRLAREMARVLAQGRRVARLWPKMRRERVEWR